MRSAEKQFHQLNAFTLEFEAALGLPQVEEIRVETTSGLHHAIDPFTRAEKTTLHRDRRLHHVENLLDGAQDGAAPSNIHDQAVRQMHALLFQVAASQFAIPRIISQKRTFDLPHPFTKPLAIFGTNEAAEGTLGNLQIQ